MKKYLNFPSWLSLLVLLAFVMSSYSIDYSKEDSRDDNPPISKKEKRNKMRLEKVKTRLNKRLKKTKNQFQRQLIQKKIRHIQKKQDDDRGTPVVGIVGMVLSILAFILFILFLGTLNSLIIGLMSIYCLIAASIAALLGLGVSIAGILLPNKNPDKFSGRGFGIAGMIIGSVMCGILLIAALLFFIFR